MTGNPKEITGAINVPDVYIVSADAKFARMLELVLFEEGISATVTTSAPKKRCFAVVDLDSVKQLPQTGADMTFSRDEKKDPTFVRPFENAEFVRCLKSRLSSPSTEEDEFTLTQGAVLYKNSMIHLSDIEYTILRMLLERRGEVVFAEEIKKIF